uniref:Hyaluronan/mRNA-binding protein domain-containing protein n=1 Tax=Anopheles atroparvus TaxID=41427 RepID=A0AAG5CS44_ANOAO
MENTSYGINVANRYDLFCIDDDAGDPMEAILKNKQKQQKKQQAAASSAAPQQPSAQAKSNAKGGGEKENKSAGGRGAENRHPDKSTAQTNGTGNLHNQRGTERRGIKETQKDNIRNQENQKTGGVGGAGGNQGNAKLPRGTGPNHKNGILAPGGGGGNDDKYRKTRDFDDGQRKPYPQNGGAAGGGPKRFDGRGKRELDRQSGSNKTGIKSVDKRDGAGSHNWGSSKQDAKEFSNLQDQEYQPQDADTSADEKTNPERTNAANGGEGETADGAANAKSEDEAKEMTLDEWKAQKAAVRLKPQYNLRKAGEGENSAQWDKMVALDRKPVKAGEAEAEDDENNDTQKAAAGGKGGKQVLEIEFHFNDNRRGGLGRTRGGRGGKAGGGGAPEGGMERPQRDNVRRNNRPPNPRASKQQHAPAAPKVDDEHDFPSLG